MNSQCLEMSLDVITIIIRFHMFAKLTSIWLHTEENCYYSNQNRKYQSTDSNNCAIMRFKRQTCAEWTIS